MSSINSWWVINQANARRYPVSKNTQVVKSHPLMIREDKEYPSVVDSTTSAPVVERKETNIIFQEVPKGWFETFWDKLKSII